MDGMAGVKLRCSELRFLFRRLAEVRPAQATTSGAARRQWLHRPANRRPWTLFPLGPLQALLTRCSCWHAGTLARCYCYVPRYLPTAHAWYSFRPVLDLSGPVWPFLLAAPPLKTIARGAFSPPHRCAGSLRKASLFLILNPHACPTVCFVFALLLRQTSFCCCARLLVLQSIVYSLLQQSVIRSPRLPSPRLAYFSSLCLAWLVVDETSLINPASLQMPTL